MFNRDEAVAKGVGDILAGLLEVWESRTTERLVQLLWCSWDGRGVLS